MADDVTRGGGASEASEPLASERTTADGPTPSEMAPSAESEREAEEIAHELDELGRAQAERDEYLDSLRRVQADFENYRKRMLREQTALVERATEGLVEQLLPVLDSLELALGSVEGESAELAKVRKGLELVYAELLGVLEKAGLSRIEAAGKPFDPTEHEAVAQDDGEGEPVVSEVFRTGYRLRGRVLRPAMVKVTR
ncbi:MAG: nucleotide exchange factor GrpE [Acidimicrobiia bacterium]